MSVAERFALAQRAVWELAIARRQHLQYDLDDPLSSGGLVGFDSIENFALAECYHRQLSIDSTMSFIAVI